MSKKIIITVGTILIIVPLLSLILMAFMVQWTYPNLLPEKLGIDGFLFVFKQPDHLLRTIGTSLFLALGAVFGTLALAIPAGKAFGCYGFRGKHLLRLLLMPPLIVPIVSVSMGIQIGFVPLGIANSFFAVLILHIVLAMPYALWFITDSFKLIGLGRESQAIQLGDNPWPVFVHITLPSLYSMLFLGILIISLIIGKILIKKYQKSEAIKEVPNGRY